MLTVSRLIGQAMPGRDAGQCRICATATERGWREAPSDSFTAWAQLYVGDVICEYCWALLKDRRFRARSWWAAEGQVRFVEGDRAWFWTALQRPPSVPFAVYVTAGHQKQGWICGARYVAQSADRYPVMTDWLDRPVWLDRAYLAAHGPLLARLRALGLSRTALLAGPRPALMARALRDGWAGMLDDLERVRHDPRWEVCVHVIP
jgi:hypothetical protein